MKFGVREICDVVLKARAPMKVGNKVFYTNEPVLYFDTLKTSSLEGASTTVYAQGGRGNARLVAWDGDRTLTFTMEDALISAEGFMILSGAGLIEASSNNTIKQHVTEKSTAVELDQDKKSVNIYTTSLPYENVNEKGEYVDDADHYIYAMLVKNDEPTTEPYLPRIERYENDHKPVMYHLVDGVYTKYENTAAGDVARKAGTVIYYCLQIKAITKTISAPTTENPDATKEVTIYDLADTTEAYLGSDGKEHFVDDHQIANFENGTVLLDYYIEKVSKVKQIEITAESFGGNFYLEASTLFRTQDGVDLPAEFIIPNCKIQSNFTFSMAATGDPSTFTFTLDAFPGTTRFNPAKKVLAAIQIIEDAVDSSLYRTRTIHDPTHDSYFDI